MTSSLRRCASCGRYTLKEACVKCKTATASPVPMRFSPQDRYGQYRRKAIIEEYGENGKLRGI